jgi:hypothetical protein
MSILAVTYIIYVLAVVLVAILVWIFTIEHRIKKFFAGTKAKNLEDVMVQISNQMGDLKNTQKEINMHLVTVDDRLGKSIRRVESIRFNPFEDAGSNQSFAVSFINDEGNGVIMSSLYARDRMSIFVKPISKGESEFELSDEEKRVLQRSK